MEVGVSKECFVYKSDGVITCYSCSGGLQRHSCCVIYHVYFVSGFFCDRNHFEKKGRMPGETQSTHTLISCPSGSNHQHLLLLLLGTTYCVFAKNSVRRNKLIAVSN